MKKTPAIKEEKNEYLSQAEDCLLKFEDLRGFL